LGKKLIKLKFSNFFYSKLFQLEGSAQSLGMMKQLLAKLENIQRVVFWVDPTGIIPIGNVMKV
jgi:hypothetical protein